MLSTNDESKGKILFKEENMCDTKILFITSVNSIIFYLSIFSIMLKKEFNIAKSSLCSLTIPLSILIIVILILNKRSFPLIIYQKGFYVPLPGNNFLNRKTRFIEFSKIKNIYPKVYEIEGILKTGGYLIIPFEGVNQSINTFDCEALKKIEEIFKNSSQLNQSIREKLSFPEAKKLPEEDPMKEVKNFTKEDWKKLEMKINSNNAKYILFVGVFILMSCILIKNIKMFIPMLILGSGITFISLILFGLTSIDLQFVQSLIKKRNKFRKTINT